MTVQNVYAVVESSVQKRGPPKDWAARDGTAY